jgi:hypothetical protein
VQDRIPEYTQQDAGNPKDRYNTIYDHLPHFFPRDPSAKTELHATLLVYL